LKCSFCGSDNPPGTRLCRSCGFILRDANINAPARRRRSHVAAGPTVGVGLRGRVENSKLGVALVLVIVLVVIVTSFFVYYGLHKDDPYLGATLMYRYNPPTDTSD